VGDAAAPVRGIVMEVPSLTTGKDKGNPPPEPLSLQFNHLLVTQDFAAEEFCRDTVAAGLLGLSASRPLGEAICLDAYAATSLIDPGEPVPGHIRNAACGLQATAACRQAGRPGTTRSSPSGSGRLPGYSITRSTRCRSSITGTLTAPSSSARTATSARSRRSANVTPGCMRPIQVTTHRHAARASGCGPPIPIQRAPSNTSALNTTKDSRAA
jgi:hypothetical protein